MLDRENLISILKMSTGLCILLIWLKKYLFDGIHLIWNSLKMINVRKLRFSQTRMFERKLEFSLVCLATIVEFRKLIESMMSSEMRDFLVA